MSLIKRFLSGGLRVGKAARLAQALPLTLDPSKPVSMALNRDHRIQISGTDRDSGRPFTLILPESCWPAMARAMGAHLSFRDLQRQREAEHCMKGQWRETT